MARQCLASEDDFRVNVAMLSDAEVEGGAALAASRFASQLVRRGHRVTRIVNHKAIGSTPWVTQRLTRNRMLARIADFLPPPMKTFLSVHNINSRLVALLNGLRPDIINIHNIHGALNDGWSLGMVKVCSRAAPVVWTLHDMWSFTGRCAYNGDCTLFRDGCDHTCPTADEYPALSPSEIRFSWEKKAQLVSRCENLFAVTPSRWLKDQAAEGNWPVERIFHIANGLPLDQYRPIDQLVARSALGIESSKPVLLVGAADWNDRRKGAGVILEALDRMAPSSVCLLVVGHGHLDSAAQEVYTLGYVDDQRIMALAYSAADLFVHAAQADNLPNVVIEAIACGTPAVGLPIGGIPEIVVPGLTGWLSKGCGANDLVDAIARAVLDQTKWQRLRKSCRSYAEEHYDEARQTARYLELFCHLVD